MWKSKHLSVWRVNHGGHRHFMDSKSSPSAWIYFMSMSRPTGDSSKACKQTIQQATGLWFNGFKFRKEKIFIEILNYNKPISLDATIRGNCLTTSTSRRLVQLLQLGLEMFGQCQTFHSFSSIIDLKWKKQKNRCSAVLLLWSEALN